VIEVNHEPKTFSMHAVLIDVALGVSRIGRDLLLAGHRRLGAVEPHGSTGVLHALRQAAARYAPDAIVDAASAEEAIQLVDSGATALVCGSVHDARKARLTLAARNIAVPDRVSLTAVGCACPQAGCSGYFVECQRIAEAIIGLLKDATTRPITFWLPGNWTERGTLAPTGAGIAIESNTPLRVSGVVV
jgi:hypothetical protein